MKDSGGTNRAQVPPQKFYFHAYRYQIYAFASVFGMITPTDS